MSHVGESFPLDETFAEYRALSGIDEAGRGCLAGPVVVACVTWNPRQVRKNAWFAKLADSKQLPATTREYLYPYIIESSERVRVAVIHPILIDSLNILGATFLGFEQVAPPRRTDTPLVIDGHLRPSGLKWAHTQVKGDALLSPVSAAGIVAKVTSDALMVGLASELQGYGFEGHKGYATASHRSAIAALGPSPQHRKSFRPVADLLTMPQLADSEFLAAIEVASSTETMALYQHFRSNYHLYSLAASRFAVRRFGQKGLALLPSPADLGRANLPEPILPATQSEALANRWDVPLWT